MAGRPQKKSTLKLHKDVARLFVEGYNASQIARMLNFSRQYINNVLRVVKVDLPSRASLDAPVIVDKHNKNVHAQNIRAFVHHMGRSYESKPNQYFKDFVDGVDVGCQGKFIYLRARDRRFSGESEHKALWNSLAFWNKVIVRLESRLDVVINKRGSMAFEFLYAEWETSGSVVAIDSEKRGHIWRVFHSDDGKLRLSVDWSEGAPNHETHHKRDAHVDSVVFQSHINDVLDNPQAPKFSELSSAIRDIALVNKETAEGLRVVVDVLRSQMVKPDNVDVEGGVPDYFG